MTTNGSTQVRTAAYDDPPKLPHVGYDPLAADDNSLETYWLPARPDPKVYPALYAHWLEMMSPTPTFVASKSVAPIHPTGRTTSPFASLKARARSRVHNSRNWSGAFVSALRANRFKRIVGRWTVPILKTGVRSSEEGQNLGFQCSIWIGLDGKKRWSDSMPQVGTAHAIEDDGTSSHELWWQWWHRGKLAKETLPWTMKGVSISPGDLILCSLTLAKSKTVRIHVINRTTGIFATVQLQGTIVDGATAEWIVERPAAWYKATELTGIAGPLHPLPDFGQVEIDQCATEQELKPTAPIFLPRLIRMKQKILQFDRVAVISSATTRNEAPGRVQLTYQRP